MPRKEANRKARLSVFYSAVHKDKTGRIIAKVATIEPPDPIQCPKLSCIWEFLVESYRYIFMQYYHHLRVKYAEANRNAVILEKYRTGEETPYRFRDIFRELIILKWREYGTNRGTHKPGLRGNR